MTGQCNFTNRIAMSPLSPFRVGFDLVQISRIVDSISCFGDGFKNRLFTADELAYAELGQGLGPERLAARFAAKEATIKALRWSNAGINWKDIEVRKLPDGDCELALHGRAAELAKGIGMTSMTLSLSHDGDYAGAVVAVGFEPKTAPLLE